MGWGDVMKPDTRMPIATPDGHPEVPGGWSEVTCGWCGGKGYHHGFGEGGHDPDWCSRCLGAAKWAEPMTDAGRAALEESKP